MTGDFSHFDEQGASRMVDVGKKAITHRVACASARVRMQAATIARIQAQSLEKGQVLEVARLAGIMGAKQTSALIPLCHPLALDRVEVGFEFEEPDCLVILTRVEVQARTGVEMEALVSASTAALTVYDMCKAIDREMTIESVRLEEKQGGRSGHYRRHDDDAD